MVTRQMQANQTRSVAPLLYLAAAFVALIIAIVASPGKTAQAGASTSVSMGHSTSPSSLAWRVVPPVTNATLHDVHMVSALDGWAVGEIPLSGVTQSVQSQILRYNGTTWNPTNYLNGDERLQDVNMLNANDGWIASWNGGGSSNIYHWNGTTWTLTYGAPRIVNRISAVAANDVYASGTGNIYHYDGAAWNIVYTSPDGDNYFAIWMVSANEGWATGTLGRILHFQNGTWAPYNSSPAPASLYDVFFTGPNDGWGTGYTDNTFVIHYNGVQWTRDYTPTNQIDRLYMLSPTEGWGTGYFAISRFQNGVWSNYPNPATEGLNSINMLNSTDGWIVGDNGTMLHYSDDATPSPTTTQQAATATSTTQAVTPSATSQPTGVPTSNATQTAVVPSPTACALQFADVPADAPFYSFVRCLACRGVMSGYACGGAGEQCDTQNHPYFRPASLISRGQIAKIVSNAAGFNDAPGAQMFEDVPSSGPGSTFYTWINRLVRRGIMSGYACGGAGEPCGAGSLPYFRPNANASRGQLSKIVSNAAGFQEAHNSQTFEDVAVGSTFYLFVERLSTRGYIGGYTCGGAGEPCGSGNLPYFRPGASVTRGQASKIVANTFFPNCQTPARK